jgi:nitrite reductase/ring-hydroxylating ferredoxin subunit
MSESFERALERLLHDQSPGSELPYLDEEEQAMLRMAQLLHGSTPSEARPIFVDELRERVVAPRRISRRTAFLTTVGALAAGLLGGLGLEHFLTSGATNGPAAVGTEQWRAVTTLADLPDGAVRAFKVDNLQGFLINRSGQISALSRTCTHMGCQLDFNRKDRALLCPCHGAEFDLHGRLLRGPGGSAYSQPLPPLPKIKTRVNGDRVEISTA